MKKVFLIHGFKGMPNGDWLPSMMIQLGQQEIYACALPMPDPGEPQKNEWVKTIADAVQNPTKDIFLVGHSLGVLAILNYLETLGKNQKIGGAVLVSGPSEPLRPDEASHRTRKIDNFMDHAFNFDKIKNACASFSVIHGADDYLVPLFHAQYYSKNLGCELIAIQNGKHLSGSDGWNELPQAFEALLKMIK